MCEDVTLQHENESATLVRLCLSYHTCETFRAILDWDADGVGPLQGSEPVSLADGEQPDPQVDLAANLLRAFSATVAIIEPFYFDIDFRSEFGATQATLFAVNDPDVDRVHFFKMALPSGAGLSIYRYVRDAVEASRSTNPGKCQYRGYMVLRSTQPRTVGRTMVAPFEQGSDGEGLRLPELVSSDPLAVEMDTKSRTGPPAASLLTGGDSLDRYVRTAVFEPVQLFGEMLPTYGVPFMEQDGALLRCAHVTAWMAHYTSVLHGLVPRRSSAAFSAAGDPSRSYGRSYPSQGLTSHVQSQVLSGFDLPPEVLSSRQLLTSRVIEWHDRTALAHADACLRAVITDPKSTREQRDKARHQFDFIWFMENLTATIARYLNSGFPVILNYGEHSYLVCGYLRESVEQRANGKPLTSDLHGDLNHELQKLLISALEEYSLDVTTLIVHDDQMGPYRTLDVRQIVLDVAQETRAISCVIPLPSGLWLSGGMAETGAANYLLDLVPSRLVSIEDRRQLYSAQEYAEMVRLTHALNEAVEGRNNDRRFAIRSYAIGAGDFKRDFPTRIGDRQEATELVRYAPLPKYVWVVEVLDRSERKNSRSPDVPDPCALDVVATVVLDGSAVSAEGVDRPPDVLFAHLPGQIYYPSREFFEESDWKATEVGLYRTGRWSQQTAGFNDPIQFMMRAKWASATA